MAVIHQAALRPTKLELLEPWLPERPWYSGPSGGVRRVANFRFDDPAGKVGVETLLVRTGDGPVHQVPLTYREAPLPGADEWLLGTLEHSVLGTRWIYDGVGDPVYAAALASAILGNTGQADQFVLVDGELEPREPNMGISSTAAAAGVPAIGGIERVAEGDPTLIATDAVELSVVRRLGPDTELPGAVLEATWPGQSAPIRLASAALRSRGSS